jgi:hypothetical protein
MLAFPQREISISVVYALSRFLTSDSQEIVKTVRYSYSDGDKYFVICVVIDNYFLLSCFQNFATPSIQPTTHCELGLHTLYIDIVDEIKVEDSLE